MIQTEITPEVQEVYKGSYNNEKLYVNGGEMLYDAFIQNEVIKKAVSGYENPDGDEQYKGKYVKQSVDNQYIFNSGEEYIFFAKKREDSEKYYSLYAYQGTFQVKDGIVKNIALKEKESLSKDICNIFQNSNQGKVMEKSEVQTVPLEREYNSGFAISEKDFVRKLRECNGSVDYGQHKKFP